MKGQEVREFISRSLAWSLHKLLPCKCDYIYKENATMQSLKEAKLMFIGTSYIGVTQTSLTRRLTMHKAQGVPREHLNRKYD